MHHVFQTMRARLGERAQRVDECIVELNRLIREKLTDSREALLHAAAGIVRYDFRRLLKMKRAELDERGVRLQSEFALPARRTPQSTGPLRLAPERTQPADHPPSRLLDHSRRPRPHRPRRRPGRPRRRPLHPPRPRRTRRCSHKETLGANRPDTNILLLPCC